ncbi:MAG: Dps family protein [Planctomycetota bacterium]
MALKNTKAARAGAPGIDEKVKNLVAFDLNLQLAHLLDLAASAKQAHWNIHGPNFDGLHLLFDTIATDAYAFTDLVAERLLALRSLAKGTIQDAAEQSTFEPFPNDESGWTPLTSALHERVMGCSNRLRASLDTVAAEPVTQDMYISMITSLEKHAWMLAAHLNT